MVYRTKFDFAARLVQNLSTAVQDRPCLSYRTERVFMFVEFLVPRVGYPIGIIVERLN